MKSYATGILTVVFIVIISAHAAPSTDNKKDNEAWVADEYNVGPAVAVEAEDESVSPAMSVEEQDDDRNSTLLYNEEPCLRGGGTCLPEIECPHGKLSDTRGLCPQQQSLGIECCHGLSLLETRCNARGGQCTDINACSRSVVEDRAEDCPDDKVCCVLVRS